MAGRVFTFFDGPNKGRRFKAADAPVTLGRDESCEVTLEDDRASRLHARITACEDGLAILSLIHI